MSVNLLVSTGTMVGRSNNYNYKRALKEIKKLQDKKLCHGCELMMLISYYDKLDDVIKAVRESGVIPVTIHCEKEVGTMISDAGVLFSEGKTSEAEKLYHDAVHFFTLNCDTAQKLDIPRMVLHLWGGISSDKNIEYNISKLPQLNSIADEYGVQLLIENIPSNTHDPLSNWHKLLPVIGNARLIFDTRFGKLHEQIKDILTDKTITEYIEHIHVSDYTGGYRNFKALRPILHPRDGVIDFDEVASLLYDMNYSGTLTLESPVMVNEDLDIPKIESTLIYLDELFNHKYNTK
jgi:sugar phosphate isomerase/epimerase